MHESIKRLIGRMIETFSLERNIEIRSASSTTFTRRDLENGVESDECYYVANALSVRGVDAIDLEIHPPPDLVVEIDVTNSSTLKLGIYERIGVPEVWRYVDGAISVLLRSDGSYRESTLSGCLPGFPLDAANALLGRRHELGETELVRRFKTEIQ
jgi:Uma2 family endonuclease